MVSVCLQAGLGNRMFCYAFALGLKAKGYDVYIDETSFKPRSFMTNEEVNLKAIFPHISFKSTPKNMFPFCFIGGKKGEILRKLSYRFLSKKYIQESAFRYLPNISDEITEKCCIIGLWQTSNYFKSCEREVKRQFEFLPFDEKENIQLSMKMNKENSIAIHVRKGNDYKDSTWENTCNADYYKNAIQYIENHVTNPIYYIFTDNIDWVKSNLKGIKYTIIDWNPTKGIRNFRDMQLMGCAKHNIIANSSYSWWAAYLNPNPSKIVVAPSIWFSPSQSYFCENEIVPEEWIKI
jgi:hypothetical protein